MRFARFLVVGALSLTAIGCEALQWQALRAYMAVNPHLEQDDGPVSYDGASLPLELEVVADGFEFPWSVTFPSSQVALVSERPGRLWRVELETGKRRQTDGLPEIPQTGRTGLFAVELDPDFARNGFVYLAHTAEVEPGMYATRLSRARLVGDSLESLEVLFTAAPPLATNMHFGGAIAFDDDGMLYLTSGDRLTRKYAQDLQSHLGKIIRLHPDGRVPADNPFVGRDDAQPEIFSWGHRNPQGLAIHPESRELWSSEHGPRGGDEINIVRAGLNYGWPIISYGEEYSGGPVGVGTHREGLEQPIHYWVPSIATSGIGFYTGDGIPAWKGDLFVAGLIGTQLCRVGLDGERVIESEALFVDLWHRVRNVRESPDRELFVLSENGSLFRVRTQAPATPEERP